MALSGYVLNGPTTVILDDDRDPFVSWQHHLDRTGGARGGVDCVASIGTPVLAPCDGVVDRRPNDGSAGNSMRFIHDSNPGWSTVFSHLDSYVGEDYQHFNQGDVIAYTGNTGGVAPHLHRHLLDPDGNRQNEWAMVGADAAIDYAYGLSSEAQRALQQYGADLGLYTGLVDGVFGHLSVSFTQQLLKDLGYLESDYEVDGVPGPLYGTALERLAQSVGADVVLDGQPGPITSAYVVAWVAAQKSTTPTPPTPGPAPLTGTLGLDVATPQRAIDFDAAVAEQIKFAIVKAGGLNVEPQYVAPAYAAEVDAARAAGLRIGHYYVPGKNQTPKEQARFFVGSLHNFDVHADVLALDNEPLDDNGVQWGDLSATEFLAEVIRLTGIPASRVWHYANASAYRAGGSWPKLEALGIRYWWAAYGDGPTEFRPDHEPDLRGSIPRWDVHQFTSSTVIGGIRVDANYSPLSLDELFAPGKVVAPEVDQPIPTIPDVPTPAEPPKETPVPTTRRPTVKLPELPDDVVVPLWLRAPIYLTAFLIGMVLDATVMGWAAASAVDSTITFPIWMIVIVAVYGSLSKSWAALARANTKTTPKRKARKR
ncbi:MAG: peptidoglycan DD-metalloendopeptidase family protein [Actinobacteria bacterium]|nr:peptidoglycan DD-metalloendopeptidase family protein [Actinomycetota bacterium]